MFQNNKKAAVATILTATLAALIGPVTAHAASSSANNARTMVFKTSLDAIEGTDHAVLDWRNQTTEINFDMSDANWTDGVELLLSADPLGRANKSANLIVQFNNDAPIEVKTRGQGFDARIALDPAKIRPRNNTLRVTYQTPQGADCLSTDDGGWRLNLNDSFVVVKARAKSRNLKLSDVEAQLMNPAMAPKSVHILARGQNTAKLQLLAAQGIGLRMEEVPEFKMTKSSSAFQVIIARRDALSGLVTDERILGGEGPRLSVHEGRPMRIVITGDTDSQVMDMAAAFATHHLPNVARTVTSSGELGFENNFHAAKNQIEGTHKLSDLNSTALSDLIGSKPKAITFNVADPANSHGKFTLRLSADKNIAKNSRIVVALNGESLGYTLLDKNRKTVAFDMPAGLLRGTNNKLTITPEFDAKASDACNFSQDVPGFYLNDNSKITIETPIDSPVAELSKLTASGAPFSIEQGADSLVILPAKSSRDYSASLKIMAQLAKSSGTSWAQADVKRASQLTSIDQTKNILFVGPNTTLPAALRENAPKALSSALKGQRFDGPVYNLASTERFASSDATATFQTFAAQQSAQTTIRSGGVAALYPSSLSNGKVIGVITNVPGLGFSSVANQLIKPQHWNNVEGSVARWNNSNVLMAQTAMSVPGFVKSRKETNTLLASLPDFGFDGFDIGKIDTSLITSTVAQASDAASDAFAALKTKFSPAAVPVSNAEVSTVPNLRGFSKIDPAAPSGPSILETSLEKSKVWLGAATVKAKEFWEQKRPQPRAETAPAVQGNWSSLSQNPLSLLVLGLGILFIFMGLIKSPNKDEA